MSLNARSSGPRIVVVLGSNRAGTSAVTRLLWLMGVELGPRAHLLGAIEGDNDRGFHEHRGIIQINDAVLHAFGGTWDRPPALPGGWERDRGLDDLRARARQLIAEDFAEAPTWGFKDPRTSLTLAFWRALISPSAYVICHRHPLAAARSLERRNGIAPAAGVALWTHYTASAIVNTAGRERCFVGYEQLFTRRQATVDALAGFLHLPSLVGAAEFHAAVDAWLEEGLRHHVPPLQTLFDDALVTPAARELFLLLELVTRSAPDPDAERALDALAARIHEAGPPPMPPS